ncbi:hypothetical protein P3S67_016996 [Capsicum chacoense]
MVDPSQEYALMEEREELMVSLVDEQVMPIFRVAHFLKPTIPSAPKLPFLPSRSKLCSSSLKVKFGGGVAYMRGWSKWVDKLKRLYQDTWKKAGIFEAILASTFKIHLHNDLIIVLAERWCVETNTFIFPWGEGTVTLEDMVVLGGFSILGRNVLRPVKTKECVEMERSLRELYKVVRARKTCVYHHAWMFVFPPKGSQNVHRDVIPIAIHLSRGNSMALAPAVLASIYRDLNLLNQLIVSSSKHTEHSSNSRCVEDESELILRSPLHSVQLWAWERSPGLQPKPGVIYCGEPRVARWHKVKKLERVDPRCEIDSAAEWFLWRPYAIDTVKNRDIDKFYKGGIWDQIWEEKS